jgi:hypothetical protein
MVTLKTPITLCLSAPEACSKNDDIDQYNNDCLKCQERASAPTPKDDAPHD